MKNVYDQVRVFYRDDVTWDPVIKKEWVDGFFRHQAWQGVNDETLRNLWRVLQMYITYLQYSAVDDLEEMTVQDYSLAIEWLSVNVSEFKVTLKNVREFFNVLIEFYKYLSGKKIIVEFAQLQRAAEDIAGGKKLNLLKAVIPENELGVIGYDSSQALPRPELSGDMAKNVGETVERLMVKLGAYFQREDFNDDFDRALYLYTGPLDSVPDEGQEEFWLGFWDYFLFDYHLLSNDATPLTHFYQTFSEKLTVEERRILQDLLSAQFTVFYVHRVINQDWVECINLFTDEKFELPFLFDYNALKKLMFFGHVFSQGMVMINYVTSIEVSNNLRKRIKEEVIRQKKVFSLQEPEASLADFFKRHALVVRHTIDVLVTLARVNATPANQLERTFPEVTECRQPHPEVMQLFEQLAPEYGFSFHDITLMKRMWHDFCQLDKVIVRKPPIWLAAILYAYSRINYTNNFSVENIAKSLGISSSGVHANCNRLYEKLALEAFDPRYLSEEGFVFLLFMP